MRREQPTLVVIGGPTASGKTAVAAALAGHLGTEVISADSRQFYHAMRIGTARPAVEDLLGVKHHFLGHLVYRLPAAGCIVDSDHAAAGLLVLPA